MGSPALPAAIEPVRAWLSGFGSHHLRSLCREADASAPWALARGLALLLWPGVRLNPAEVRLYNLHRRDRSRGPSRAFIGEVAWVQCCRRLNRGSNRVLTDKLTLSYFLAGSRLGAPPTQAYLGVEAPLLPVPTLRTRQDVRTFLRRQARFPVFVKPLRGSQGKGCLAIEGFDSPKPWNEDSTGGAGDAVLRLGDGGCLPLERLAEQLQHDLGRGAILQDRISPHPLLRPVCGDACPTVRLLTACDSDGVTVLAAILKLPGAGAMVDNLHSASDRQPLALVPVDPDSGTLGAWRRFDGQCSLPLETPLPLAAIPDWSRFVEAVTTLHRLDGDAVLLGWDLAVAAEGPMVVEVNGVPGIDLWQLAHGRGFGDAAGRALLRQLEGRARWIRRRPWRRIGLWLALPLRPQHRRAGARRAG